MCKKQQASTAIYKWSRAYLRYKSKRIEEFDQMIQKDICHPSKSALHMVKIPDGTWRTCGDYRTHNAKTVPDK